MPILVISKYDKLYHIYRYVVIFFGLSRTNNINNNIIFQENGSAVQEKTTCFKVGKHRMVLVFSKFVFVSYCYEFIVTILLRFLIIGFKK